MDQPVIVKLKSGNYFNTTVKPLQEFNPVSCVVYFPGGGFETLDESSCKTMKKFFEAKYKLEKDKVKENKTHIPSEK